MFGFEADFLALRVYDLYQFSNLMAQRGWQELGYGDEAICFKKSLEEGIFPAIVCRFNLNTTTFEQSAEIWRRHAFCYFLDQHFVKEKKYFHAHITRPLLPFSAGHSYEFAPGREGFAWDNASIGRNEVLPEWNEFCNAFSEAGVSIGDDISDCDNAFTAKNVVQTYDLVDDEERLSSNWYRIDFGSRSLHIDQNRLHDFIKRVRLRP